MTTRPVVAIIGRPNVGKSTLFNKIVGRKQAIVEDQPGVTRDRNYADVEHDGREFVVVDTGGFDPDAKDGMLALMRRQVELAQADADALVLVFDGREGLTGTDEAIWELVRTGGKPCYVVVNKCDRPSDQALAADFYRLGLSEVFITSAENGSGVNELLDRVLDDLDAPAEQEAVEEDGQGPIRIAIVGRPNVGKSSLANALLGKERFLTSDVPGTTRDSVDTSFTADGRDYLLVDTAGMRRPKNVGRGVERMSVARSVQAMERSHVTVLVVDAQEGVTDQEKRLLSLIIDRGRAIVLVVNKWDLVTGGSSRGDEYRRRLEEEIPFASFVPHVFTSALTGRNVRKVLQVVNKVHENLFRRIPTSELNRFYEEVVQRHPPQGGARVPKIRYLMQAQVNPPVILLFAGGKGKIPPNYERFLLREIRERYDYSGVPVLLIRR